MSDPNPRFELPDDRRDEDACRPPSAIEGWLLILLALPMPLLVIAIVASGMPPLHVGLIIAGLAAFSVVVFWSLVRVLWEPYRRRYPAVRPTEATVWESMQIVRLGLVGGFNHCVIVGSDTAHVHLRLMLPFGWFARPMSIPRAEIEWDGDGPMPKSTFGMAKVRLAGRRSRLPMWVFR